MMNGAFVDELVSGSVLQDWSKFNDLAAVVIAHLGRALLCEAHVFIVARGHGHGY
jgi:hypothetical protein